MNKFIIVFLLSFVVACGRRQRSRLWQGGNPTANPEVVRLRAEPAREREANRRLATGQAPAAPAPGAPVTGSPASPVAGGHASQGIPGVAPPAAPRLCAGVDPSLVNVPAFQAVRTESQGFGGQFLAGGTVNGHLLIQNSRFWTTVVINDQVQTASTGPVGGEFRGMILARTQSD